MDFTQSILKEIIKMIITMRYDEYNKMQDFAKQFAAKAGGWKPILEYIKITVTRDTAKAEALNGYKAGYIMLSLSNSEGEGSIILPITSKLKKSDVFAVITESEKEIEIRTATGASLYRKPDGEYLNTSNIYPQDEPQQIFGFDPSLLADALKAFSGEKAVKIEYRGALKPLVIKSSTAHALVLPVRLKD
jgi:DNA polymerase III sliding clamp (beta) subunit (PCNA family)